MKMKCPRCHNQEVRYFYRYGDQIYCRQCIMFHRVNIEKTRQTLMIEYPRSKVQYSLSFELSQKQKEISQQLKVNYQKHCHSLVLAVCGSGKTEIVFELIAYALSKGHRVCFCVPRKELVKELYERIQDAFSRVEIGVAYGGRQENLDAQFIVCTMHQLYRFENHVGFQLMIADEVDAFPFYGNEILQQIFERCCLGSYVKLSATFTKEDVKDEELLIMNRRYHGHDLPLPQVIYMPHMFQKLMIKYIIQHLPKRILVFVPQIKYVDQLVMYLQRFSIKAAGVSSKHLSNQKAIQQLKNNEIRVIVSTTLLERGITIEDVQVIVYHGDHDLFDSRTLIQIAGRAGRKPDHPDGKVYILSDKRTVGIQKCIHTIKELNTMTV